jgi:hypothetical protein
MHKLTLGRKWIHYSDSLWSVSKHQFSNHTIHLVLCDNLSFRPWTLPNVTFECNRFILCRLFLVIGIRVKIMVFNVTFNNISVISGRSVLLVEESEVPGENHRPAASHWRTLSNNVLSSTPRLGGIRGHNVSGDKNWLHR